VALCKLFERLPSNLGARSPFVRGVSSSDSLRKDGGRKMPDIDDQIERKILQARGKPVSFKYPGNEGERNGILEDRIVVRKNPGAPGVPYWRVVDLIEFHQDQQRWIRFGYFRKPKERLNWASQTTATFSIEEWRGLFVKAAREKAWFRNLLNDVMGELSEDTNSVRE
jgi:hypothetical protein